METQRHLGRLFYYPDGTVQATCYAFRRDGEPLPEHHTHKNPIAWNVQGRAQILAAARTVFKTGAIKVLARCPNGAIYFDVFGAVGKATRRTDGFKTWWGWRAR